MKNLINNLITSKKLVNDRPISIDGKDGSRILLKVDNKVYLHNKQTNKAYVYTVDAAAEVIDFSPITLAKYNAVITAYKTRMEQAKADRAAAEARVKEAERKAQVVDNSAVNAPASSVAVRLDAEREDSKFDYRRSEEIFSRSEAEAYEDLGGFFEDEEGVISLGHHKAVYLRSEVERARTYVGRNGQTYEQKAYLKMTFEVEGKEFTTRAYRMHFNSFKIQANQKFHGIFTYTKESQALEELVGQTFDIWVVYNDMIRELQADFYDKAAYAARKAEQAKAGFVRGGYGRPTENKATR